MPNGATPPHATGPASAHQSGALVSSHTPPDATPLPPDALNPLSAHQSGAARPHTPPPCPASVVMRDDEMDIDEPGEEREMDIFTGLLVNSPLQRAAIATGNPRSKDWRFKRMSAYELMQENNIAKNKETMKRLGLKKTFEEMQEEMGWRVGKGKCKAAGAAGNGKPGGCKTKCTRVDADRGSSGDDKED
ncbi:hypothetical protein B0H14DRAFT_3539248 [Mycena olivaceomarginata]|nr:hypothetical protein B0H14DRAFT_3539248 [Mycena olivaceomarginata]